jgi:hypothetical protein
VPENEAFTADMQSVVSTLSTIPRGSGTVEQFAAASKAFAGAVERHTTSGFLGENRDSALTLFYSGYSLMARLDDVQDIPAEIHEEAWEAYEGLASLLGIDLVLLHGTESETAGGEN